MKINKKLIITTIIIILALITISSTIFAATIKVKGLNNNEKLGQADTELQNMGSRIFTAISNVGVVISVVVIAAIGVKYMIGSAEEKAEYKKSMMPYLIGAILIFMASTIGRIVYEIFSKIN